MLFQEKKLVQMLTWSPAKIRDTWLIAVEIVPI